MKTRTVVAGLLAVIFSVLLFSCASNTASQQYIPISEEYVGKREVLDWYTSLGQISTRTVDPVPASVIVDVVIGYKVVDKVASTEITQRQVEIVSVLRRYFSRLTVEDLKPQNEDKRCTEIKKIINRKAETLLLLYISSIILLLFSVLGNSPGKKTEK